MHLNVGSVYHLRFDLIAKCPLKEDRNKNCYCESSDGHNPRCDSCPPFLGLYYCGNQCNEGTKTTYCSKVKYSSYKGEIGKKADNLIQRQFEASKPYEKCYTDVTEFAIPASSQKLYLSPVLDGYNSEIIAYQLLTSPNLEQIKQMLTQAFPDNRYDHTILHSDQGWQYQHQFYHNFLNQKGIRPSMSRKRNSPDNGMMASFFGILKSEMFYGYEKTFQSLKAR